MWAIPEWALGVGFIIVAGSIAKALVGRFSPPHEVRGRHASRRDVAQTLDDMQRRVTALEDARNKPGELEDLQARLSEVEERLDFAERLLAKPKT